VYVSVGVNVHVSVHVSVGVSELVSVGVSVGESVVVKVAVDVGDVVAVFVTEGVGERIINPTAFVVFESEFAWFCTPVGVGDAAPLTVKVRQVYESALFPGFI
jgi:hypothetical protein